MPEWRSQADKKIYCLIRYPEKQSTVCVKMCAKLRFLKITDSQDCNLKHELNKYIFRTLSTGIEHEEFMMLTLLDFQLLMHRVKFNIFTILFRLICESYCYFS